MMHLFIIVIAMLFVPFCFIFFYFLQAKHSSLQKQNVKMI